MSFCCDQNQPPRALMAGTQTTFTASQYSSADYTLQFVFNNGVDAPTPVNATVSGTGFSVTATAPTKPGVYAWAEVYTKTSDSTKHMGRQGTTTVTPNPLLTATPSTAQTILTRLLSSQTEHATRNRDSASFNGQSVSWNSPGELQSQITYWQAIVYREQREAAALRGEDVSGLIRPIFVQPGFPHC